MRVRSRLVLGFCGLALAVPSALPAFAAPQDGLPAGPLPSGAGATVINLQESPVVQASPGGLPQGVTITPEMSGPSTAPTGGPINSAAPSAPMPAHHHHGLLGRRHCVECQRARAKAADGVDIPPPPGFAGAQVMAPGETIVSGPVVVSERIVSTDDPHAPGYAVVGGQETAAPGYAVVNGQGPNSDPTPIGLARGAQAMSPDPRMAGAMPRPGAGPYDPAVMQSSIPPAPTGMAGPAHDRPHIISHIFGLPKLGRHYEERVERKRGEHAAIAYGDSGQKVTDLPASVVYKQK